MLRTALDPSPQKGIDHPRHIDISSHAIESGAEHRTPKTQAQRHLITHLPLMNTDGISEQSVYLRVQFRNVDAAYYQFHVFPTVDSRSNISLSRIRNADSQFMQVFFESTQEFAEFELDLHRNPHVISVEEVTEGEFLSKRSEAV